MNLWFDLISKIATIITQTKNKQAHCS